MAEFAAGHKAEVDFHRWLQWLLDELTTAQATALSAGMELGIMADLAVGVDPDGADAWALQDAHWHSASPPAPRLTSSTTSSVRTGRSRRGVPTFSPKPPANRSGRSSTRRRHAGGVRIDHIIGLLPGCGGSRRGANRGHLRPLRPRGDDRHPRAEAGPGVGEDLGTVERWVRESHLHGARPVGRSCGSRPTPGRARRCLPSAGGRPPCRRSPPTICRQPPVIWPGSTCGCATSWACWPLASAEELELDRSRRPWLIELRRAGLLPDADADAADLEGTPTRGAGPAPLPGTTPSRLLAMSLADAVRSARPTRPGEDTDEYARTAGRPGRQPCCSTTCSPTRERPRCAR